MPATELIEHLRRREVSAVELLEAVLARADALEPALNPFSVRLDERARTAARHADTLLAHGRGGPLTGLPVTAKDSQWLAGVESAHGSLTMQGFVPERTAVVLERSRGLRRGHLRQDRRARVLLHGHLRVAGPRSHVQSLGP